MRPMRYKGTVVGMRQFDEELNKEIARVRKLGLRNCENVADPHTNSCPGVWYDHVDPDDPDQNPYEVSSFVRNKLPFAKN